MIINKIETNNNSIIFYSGTDIVATFPKGTFNLEKVETNAVRATSFESELKVVISLPATLSGTSITTTNALILALSAFSRVVDDGSGSTFSGSYTDLTNIPTSFTPSTHTHNASDINAGTLNIARIPTGNSATTVSLGNHTHTATGISDSTTVGRSVLTAADASAARTAIGAGTSSLVIGTTAGTAGDGAVLAGKANTASPTFTGTPAGPTAAVGTNTTQLASTAFVLANAGKNKTQISALVSPTADYADLTEVTAAVKSIIDALKA